ncbi:MAG: glycosyltransferase family 4 protein [Candidatus Sumerlaeota bacterium]|nr:glycosyltransferase family 4 protein [Candidatus Sumerlaeota bacterium]
MLKRLLFVINTLETGGAQRYMIRLIKYLQEAEPEWKAHILTLLPGKHALKEEAKEAGAEVRSLDMRAWNPLLWRRAWLHILRLNPDLIQSFLWFADNLAGWAAWREEVELFFISEQGDRELFERGPRWKRSIAQWMDHRFVIPNARLFMTNAEHGAERLDKWGYPTARIRVIHGGVDFPPPPPPAGWSARKEIQAPPNMRLIGWAGRMEKIKRVDLLIAAVREMRRKNYPIGLVLLGNGPAYDKLKALARQLKIIQAVKFVGNVPRPTDWFREMDVCALTSDVDLFPSAVLEAMACGRPVVATRVGGVPEIIKDEKTGLLIPPGDLDALVAALLRILTDPAMAKKMGEAARKDVAARFSAKDKFEEWRTIYRELLKEEEKKMFKNFG